ncbi:MAG: peptidylprolyl isomerase [Motiliproteus sp.]
MASSIKSLWREPLIHFLAIGAALFFLYELNQQQISESPTQINVNSSQIEQLIANFNRSWMRPPSQRELDSLIDNHIREEIFYREAMAVGLDRDDPIVRRRMRQKLEFSLESLSDSEPTDDELIAFMQQHQQRFRTEPKLTFQQVYIDPRKHQQPNVHALSLREQLNQGATPEQLSDSTLMPTRYQQASKSDIARVFGERLSETILTLETQIWSQPVSSPFGAHLIKISQHQPGQLPELNQIRDIVTRELLALKRDQQLDSAYQRMRQDYRISIEPLAQHPAAQAQSQPPANGLATNIGRNPQ